MRYDPVDESIGFPRFRVSIRTHRTAGFVAAVLAMDPSGCHVAALLMFYEPMPCRSEHPDGCAAPKTHYD